MTLVLDLVDLICHLGYFRRLVQAFTMHSLLYCYFIFSLSSLEEQISVSGSLICLFSPQCLQCMLPVRCLGWTKYCERIPYGTRNSQPPAILVFKCTMLGISSVLLKHPASSCFGLCFIPALIVIDTLVSMSLVLFH